MLLTNVWLFCFQCILSGEESFWQPDEDFRPAGSRQEICDQCNGTPYLINTSIQIDFKYEQFPPIHSVWWPRDLLYLVSRYQPLFSPYTLPLHPATHYLPSLYSSGLQPRWLTSVETPSTSLPCQLGHVSGHSGLYLRPFVYYYNDTKLNKQNEQPLRLQVVQREGQSPLQEGFKAPSIGKASSPDPQVLHQAKVLHLVSDQNLIKPSCRERRLILWHTPYSMYYILDNIQEVVKVGVTASEACLILMFILCFCHKFMITRVYTAIDND